ncbi:hypothetical protein B0A49_01356 [Cryomyces minteri]|uniref:Nucleosome assembly protein C36B7.08c n=1 Tax=Cryomyces minteri TaxID=331657 RepID=A0A4U0XU35_9PEZI|nr:hypothetical protein B0A49_01356 [Cryomyces minteri]
MEEETSPVSYEDLAQIEDEFEQIDTEIMRKQYILSAPVYAKRQAAIARISHFWPLVFEQAPVDIDQYIQPSDSQLLAECLTGLNVTRFEVPLGPERISEEVGNPRSVCITFEFAVNDWFTDQVLEKKFWYRRAADGWTGLVSEPVKIHWKKGKDLTMGLTDAAVRLWEARQKAGDMRAVKLPEYEALAKKVASDQSPSFFAWFGFVTARRWVSAEESAKAEKERESRRNKRKEGEEKAASPEIDISDDAFDDQNAEVMPTGDELAISIGDDLWPGALKYFTEAQENADDEMSEADFEDDDAEGGSDDEAPIDIRSLVTSKGKDKDKSKNKAEDGPPKKKQKK